MPEFLQSDLASGEAGRRGGKSAAAFRTISEVARELDVPQHVLRFWESKFTQVKPLKRGGGRRYYRPEDIELLRSIRSLLYRDGYTIKGVQKLLREGQVARDGAGIVPAANGNGIVASAPPAAAKPAPVAVQGAAKPALTPTQRREIEAVISELTALKKLLQG